MIFNEKAGNAGSLIPTQFIAFMVIPGAICQPDQRRVAALNCAELRFTL